MKLNMLLKKRQKKRTKIIKIISLILIINQRAKIMILIIQKMAKIKSQSVKKMILMVRVITLTMMVTKMMKIRKRRKNIH